MSIIWMQLKSYLRSLLDGKQPSQDPHDYLVEWDMDQAAVLEWLGEPAATEKCEKNALETWYYHPAKGVRAILFLGSTVYRVELPH